MYDDEHQLLTCYSLRAAPAQVPKRPVTGPTLPPPIVQLEKQPEPAPYEADQVRSIVAEAHAFVEASAQRGEVVLPEWWPDKAK